MNAFVNITICLMVFVFMARIQELYLFLEPLYLGKVAVVFGLIAAASYYPKAIGQFLKETDIGKTMLFILALAFVGMPFAVSGFWGTIDGFEDLVKTQILAPILVSLTILGRKIQTLRFACAASILMLAVAMVMNIGEDVRLAASKTYDPNDIALVFVVFIPIAFAETLQGGILKRLTYLAAVGCGVIGVALSSSRGGVLGLAAMGIHTIIVAKRGRLVLLIVFAGAAALMMVMADQSLWSRFGAVQDESDYNFDPHIGRIAIWTQGVIFMLKNPILGVGVKQYSMALGMMGGGLWKNAHNSFVQIGAELGLFGLGSFLFLLFSVGRVALKGIHSPLITGVDLVRYHALFISLTGFCVAGFFLSQAYGSILYVFLALAGAMELRLRAMEEAVGILPVLGQTNIQKAQQTAQPHGRRRSLKFGEKPQEVFGQKSGQPSSRRSPNSTPNQSDMSPAGQNIDLGECRASVNEQPGLSSHHAQARHRLPEDSAKQSRRQPLSQGTTSRPGIIQQQARRRLSDSKPSEASSRPRFRRTSGGARPPESSDQ